MPAITTAANCHALGYNSANAYNAAIQYLATNVDGSGGVLLTLVQALAADHGTPMTQKPATVAHFPSPKPH
jgi:hypothetical protein